MYVSPNCCKNCGSGIITSNLWNRHSAYIGQRYMLEAATLNPSPSEFKDWDFFLTHGIFCWVHSNRATMGFPCGSVGKESACTAGDLGSIPGLGRTPGEWKGYRLQYSGLENSMDCIAYGVTKSRTQPSNFHFHFSNREMPGICQHI